MKRKGLIYSTLLTIVILVIANAVTINSNPATGDGTKVEDDIGKSSHGSKTDDEVVQREEEAIKLDGLNVSEMKQIKEKAEKYQFQAEVDRMMKLIINSLYKNKEIFLRELISNASDALDKIRFLSLTDDNALGGTTDLKIQIKADQTTKTLHIIDTGIGMTKADLVNNLGTIAKSGTSDFLSKMSTTKTESEANDLIGQFGVGFYSAFLVSDSITVVSKNNDDKQHIWSSDANSFSVTEDPRGNTLQRGTEIILKLKEEALDYLNIDTLKNLVKKYSQFINFPIYVWASTTKSVPVEPDTTEPSEEKKDEDATVEEDKPKSEKTVEKTFWDWELVNMNKPIWTRKSSNVTDNEYNEFYKSFSKDTEDPLAKTHFTAEGEVTFKSILYIPIKNDNELLTNVKKSDGIKMYVRRVFITDNFEDMMPNYLNFVKGVVDSDDLPLNVSRETLQQHKLLKVIKKKLVRKTLDMIKKLSKDEYEKFWKEYSTNIKIGVYDDSSNRTRLSKLIRFYTSLSSKKLTSFEEYVERMKPGQEHIYYITGTSMEEVKASPFVERLLNKGYEVCYLIDAVDEYFLQQLTEFNGKKLKSVAKDDLDFNATDQQKAEKESYEKLYKPLIDYMQNEVLKDYVQKVQVSERLTKSPVALVAPAYAWSGNMERIMTAQTMQKADDPTRKYHREQKKILEINPRHPVIREFNKRIGNDVIENENKEMALLLYETATLRSGYLLPNTANFADRVEILLRKTLDIDLTEKPDEIVEDAKDSLNSGQNENDMSDVKDDKMKSEDDDNDQEDSNQNENESENDNLEDENSNEKTEL